MEEKNYTKNTQEYFHSNEIASQLVGITDNAEYLEDVGKCLYDIYLIAKNEYNSDYWRVFYNVLADICKYDFDN